ncbi:MAG TPA: immunoglobulin domain-containing protein, partial [Clostridia bacterium]|nr:immunoglobulin domain-containing protein [Clostridia bacterium]
PVGFLNPALYAIGKGSNYLTCFHDITTGNNTNRLSPERFFAVPGYDLCTGWGTPTGSNLINALAPPPSTPILVVEGASLLAESCSPFNGLIDPGEVVTVSLRLRNLGVKDTSNLVATLLTNSGITPVSGPGTYGVIPARGPVAEQTFEFSAQGACGSRILIELQLRDGASDLGKVSLEMPLGQTITSFNQDFEGVQLPALPWSCSTSSTNGGSNWLTSIIAQPNGSNAVYVVEAEVPSISDLVSPVINLTSPGAMLSFRQNYYLEADPDLTTNGYDGGVLEIKIADEPFRDILDAGGSFAAGGYTRTLDPQNDNPLGGRRAWSGLSGGFITTLVNLPASATGNPIQFRWRLGTDTFNGLGGTGWYLDDVSVIVGYSCCGDSNAAPEIVVHPVNRVAAVGTDASLLVATTGSFPLSFQWHLNGTDLVGATTNPLTLTNVQLAQAGDYSVVVTNRAGSAISTPAHLTVLLRPSIELVGFGTSGTELSISVETVPGVNYTLEYKDSLDAPNWTPVLPAVQGNGGMILLKDTTGIQSASRFYRVSSH